jgi:hypothetical protein
MWEPRRLIIPWASTACYRDSLTFFLNLLTDEQKLQRISILGNLQMSLPVTRRGLTVMTLKPKQQSSHCKSPASSRPGKHDRCPREWKQCCLFSFDQRSIMHYEFAPEGQKINQDFYLAVLRHQRNAIRRKLPEMWTAGCWLLHHYNAPAHTGLSIRQFLAKH